MTAQEMRQRAKILAGEEVEEEEAAEDFERLQVTDSESDENEDDSESGTANRFEQTANLIYNESDNEAEGHAFVRESAEPRAVSQRKKFNIFDMVKSGADDKSDAEDVEINSEDIHSRLAGLVDSDESDAEVASKPKRKTRVQMLNSDSEDEKSPNGAENPIDDINSEDILGRLAALNDSDDAVEKASPKKFNRIIDSEDSDVENNQSSVNTTQRSNGNNKKRERSSSDDEMSAKPSGMSAAKKRKSQQIADSDDDADE